MNNSVQRIPIKYTISNQNIKLINRININMEEDYIFEGSDITTNINHNLFDISTAIKEINKINNLEYVKTGN